MDTDIFNLINLDNIIFKLNVESRKKVLESAIELFQHETGLSTFELLYAFHTREQMGSTHLKTRTAIPHAFMNMPTESQKQDPRINDFFIVLIVLEKTIDWEGINCNNNPVDVVAVCFSKSKRVCLHYVTILNSFMSDADIIDQIKKADSKETIYNIITNELKGE